MNLEAGFVRARVAAADLRPPLVILAGRAQSPCEMDRPRPCRSEVKRLLSFAFGTVGPGDPVDNRVGSIHPDETMEVDGYRTSSVPIIGGRLQAHFSDASIWSRVPCLWGHEHQACDEHNEHYE